MPKPVCRHTLPLTTRRVVIALDVAVIAIKVAQEIIVYCGKKKEI